MFAVMSAKNTMVNLVQIDSLPKFLLMFLGCVTLSTPVNSFINLATPLTCGVTSISLGRNARVIGGKAAQHGQFPWTVSLRKKRGQKYEHSCAGSLVSNRHIVTAAHCLHRTTREVEEEDELRMWQVVVGEHRPDFQDEGEQIMKIEKIRRHPNYKRGHLRNDIAVLRLMADVKLSDFVAPVCLPNINQTVSASPDGAIIAGWG